MSHQEKVSFVDKELRKLQAQCLRSGYNATQVEMFAGCFFQSAAKVTRERLLKTGIVVAVSVILLFVLLQVNFSYRLAAAVSRAALIKTLTVWDWTQVYHSRCLLSNPLYTNPNSLVLDDCQICEGVQAIQHVHNVEATEALDRWFKRDMPLIVEDGLRDWKDHNLLSPRRVAELYEEDEALRSQGGCGFSSNVRVKHGGHRAFLRSIVSENLTHYFAHWENCRSSAAKAFRMTYHRPYFLSQAVEMSATSWVFISNNYTASIFKRVDIDHPLLLLLQVSGQVEIQVEPWAPCDQVCPVLRDTLKAGQVLIVTEFLWKVSYLPSPHHDNVAIGLGASF